MAAGGGGRKSGGLGFNGYRVPVWEDEMFWRWMVMVPEQYEGT